MFLERRKVLDSEQQFICCRCILLFLLLILLCRQKSWRYATFQKAFVCDILLRRRFSMLFYFFQSWDCLYHRSHNYQRVGTISYSYLS